MDPKLNVPSPPFFIPTQMLFIMAAFVACWTPATVMIVLQFFRLGPFDHPLVDILAALFAVMAGVTSPVSNLVFFFDVKKATGIERFTTRIFGKRIVNLHPSRFHPSLQPTIHVLPTRVDRNLGV